MTVKDQLLQEIEQAPEPLLEETLAFLRSRKEIPTDPVGTFLDQLRASGDYADDVTPEELAGSDVTYQDYLERKDPGVSLEELELELFGKHLE